MFWYDLYRFLKNRPYNEFRRILSSRHFRSTLCLSLIICTLLYFLIVAFVVRQLSGTMTDKAVGTANAVCADMQGTLSAIQSNAVSIFFKKFTGVTPKDFRRQNLPETGANSTDDGKDSD